MTGLTWHQVKDPEDRRKVVYWRFGTGSDRGWRGAVAHRSEGWRALRYEYPDATSNGRVTELGFYATKHEAQRVVEAAVPREEHRPMNQYVIVVTGEDGTEYVAGPFQSEQALNTAMTRIGKYNDGSWTVRALVCQDVDDLID